MSPNPPNPKGGRCGTCPTCGSDDPGWRKPITDEDGVDAGDCDDPFHQPPDPTEGRGGCSCRDDHTSWCEAGCCVVCGKPDCPTKNRAHPTPQGELREALERIEKNAEVARQKLVAEWHHPTPSYPRDVGAGHRAICAVLVEVRRLRSALSQPTTGDREGEESA